MRFTFVAKHRVIWPVNMICGILGVSRSGFYAWLSRPRSQRSLDDEAMSPRVRESFLLSDRTYGARRILRDLLVEGFDCGLPRSE